MSDITLDTRTPGIHHITAIAGDPQKNLGFYSGLLGLRLVKTTVNFDDPTTYHLYYGDSRGNPGTILTFFVWPGGHRAGINGGLCHTARFSRLLDREVSQPRREIPGPRQTPR
jgi:glyoxalase family protein